MSFYLNDFKQHLKALHDKVDHPYDTPLGRDMNTSKNTTSLSEAYGNMKTSRTGNFQRPAPSQLNEQGMPGMANRMQASAPPKPTNPDGTPYIYPKLGIPDGTEYGQIITHNGNTYFWNGYGWVIANYGTVGMNEAAKPYRSLMPKWHQMKGTEVDIIGQPIEPYTPVTPPIGPEVTPDGKVVPIPGTDPQLYTNGIAVFDALGKEIMP